MCHVEESRDLLSAPSLAARVFCIRIASRRNSTPTCLRGWKSNLFWFNMTRVLLGWWGRVGAWGCHWRLATGDARGAQYAKRVAFDGREGRRTRVLRAQSIFALGVCFIGAMVF